ncbi:hypothetical protein ACFVWN_07450 [Nocardiopsis flavescens]|uniref:hypothetical protein n=1 Tax=Nocardiopsis flavescens TaxID=758803 RepID=UPI003668FCE2
MMNEGPSRQRVVWGTCWYYEPLETLSLFLEKVVAAASRNGISVTPVVFDADHSRPGAERRHISSQLKCTIIPNWIDVYPNKNFGIAIIAQLADQIDSDIVTVVDSDWDVEDFDYFLTGLLGPIFTKTADIVVPDVSPCAGRDNRLVGCTIAMLLHPGLIDSVATPFPGALAGSTQRIRDLTEMESYHYDWGGELDILSEAWAGGYRISSPYLGMKNVRHRSSQSKAHDAFQMWRSGLERLDLHVLEQISSTAEPWDSTVFERLGVPGLSDVITGTATAQLVGVTEYLRGEYHDRTVQQIVPMVLAPLAYLVDGINPVPYLAFPSDDTASPYDPSKLPLVSEIARYAAREAIVNADITSGNEFVARLRSLTGGFFGDWTPEKKAAARSVIPEKIADLGSAKGLL